jgi:histidinol-phosphate aminotransferase
MSAVHSGHDDPAARGAPPFTRLVAGLDAANPFVGPEALERGTGRRFRARVGANESAFGMSPRARAAAAAAIERLSWYGDPENYDLRADLAAYHGVDVDQVLVGAGIDDLLALVVRGFATDGGRAVMAHGSYPTFAYHTATFGVPLDTAPYGADDHVDLAALAAQARASEASRARARDAGAAPHGAGVVYLANPDNPSGTWQAEAAVRDFVAALPAGCILALDEAYIDYAPTAPARALLTDDPRVVHLRTFSKAHGMAGARIAYAVGAAAVCTGLNRLRLQFGVSRVAQDAARASLTDAAFVAGVAREVAAGRAAYHELGRSLGLPTLPSATNFVCFDLGTRRRAEAVMAALIECGVFVRKPPAPPLDRCIRLSVGTDAERRIVAAELRRVLEALPV